jgi:hypothetical protein
VIFPTHIKNGQRRRCPFFSAGCFAALLPWGFHLTLFGCDPDPPFAKTGRKGGPTSLKVSDERGTSPWRGQECNV